MIFEHFAINVKEPKAVRDWYCTHLGMQVATENPEPPFMIFLADSSGRTVCELYYRPDSPLPDYHQEHHLKFHFAFESENAEGDKNRLLEAGASFIEELKPDAGSHLVMLRDPWGLPLQICQRSKKLGS